MSTPDNFQSAVEWSQNYLKNQDTKNSGTGPLSFLFIALLLVLAVWWWWIFYGSSIRSKKNVQIKVPRAGFDELSSSLRSNPTKMVVKSNGMVAAN